MGIVRLAFFSFARFSIQAFLLLLIAHSTFAIPPNSELTQHPQKASAEAYSRNWIRAPVLSQSHTDPLAKMDRPLRELVSSGGQPNDLYFRAIGRIRVLITLTSGADVRELQPLAKIGSTFNLGGGMLVLALVRPADLGQLAAFPGVVRIFTDRRLDYTEPRSDLLEREGPLLDMFRVREILRVNLASSLLGANGSGVSVAVVDTGVDFAHPELTPAIMRDALGRPLMFDPDEQGLVITNLTVTRSGTSLNTAGKTAWVWNGSRANPVTISVNFKAPTGAGSLSLSGIYHFGFVGELLLDAVLGAQVFLLIPAVLVDPTVSGVYDTAYFDLSTAYSALCTFWNSRGKPCTPNPAWSDKSFADESPHRIGDGTEVVARDFSGDSIPDFTAGTLGTSFGDAFGVMHALFGLQAFGIFPGMDPGGNFIALMFDFVGHGTNVAGSIASQGARGYNLYSNGTLYALKGVAPSAKILAVKALWFGDVFTALAWAAGFDFEPLAPLGMTYSGQHRVDIISNSWGVSDWPFFALGAAPGYDLLSLFEDLLALPTFGDVYPTYPGVLIVHAAGNGGPGYGTVTTAGSASFILTAGASTSFHYRPVLKPSDPEGKFDDVVPFSARGPNALGEPKPDVVNLGAFAFDVAMTYYGYGDAGANSFSLFGGTSLAAPLTAGVSALVIQALESRGLNPRSGLVKSIVVSTAHDLSNDPFVQGAGRVDAFKAVSAAKGADASQEPTFYGYSTATWNAVRTRLQPAFSTWFGALFPALTPSYSLVVPKLIAPSIQPNWFAGYLSPGSTAKANFTLTNPTSSQISVNIDSYTYIRLGEESLIKGLASGNNTYLPLAFSPPPGTRLLRVTLTYPFAFFDAGLDYSEDNVLFLYVYDGDASNTTTRRLVSLSTTILSTPEIRIAEPSSKFTSSSGAWARIRLFKWNGTPIPFSLRVTYYGTAPWSPITTGPGTETIRANGTADFTAILNIPSNASSGIFEGYLRATGSNGQKLLIPVAYSVLVSGSSPTNSFGGGTYDGTHPYENNVMYGGFDWGWRYESGDWKLFKFNLRSDTLAAIISVAWTDPLTDIDLFLLAPNGIWLDMTGASYLGNGKFLRTTRTGTTSEHVFLDPASFGTGTYTILLHAVLLGGSSNPEVFRGEIRLAKLTPNIPHAFVRPDSTTILPVIFSSGFPATFGFVESVVTEAEVSAAISPLFITIDGSSSVRFDIQLSASPSAMDGRHILNLNVLLTAQMRPFTIIVSRSITVIAEVDGTPPSAVITHPSNSDSVSGVVTITFNVFDAHLHSATLYIDHDAYNVTGSGSFRWDTASVPDGAHTIRLVAKDEAGNERATSITVRTTNTLQSVFNVLSQVILYTFPAWIIVGFILGYYTHIRRVRTKPPSPPPATGNPYTLTRFGL